MRLRAKVREKEKDSERELENIFFPSYVQSNLCIATTLGTQNLWPLLTGGRCSEVALLYEN